MHPKQISPEAAEATLKTLILQFHELSDEVPNIELVVNPVTDVVNCRVEVKSLDTRKALMDHYMGISVGKSVYFCISRGIARNPLD